MRGGWGELGPVPAPADDGAGGLVRGRAGPQRGGCWLEARCGRRSEPVPPAQGRGACASGGTGNESRPVPPPPDPHAPMLHPHVLHPNTPVQAGVTHPSCAVP